MRPITIIKVDDPEKLRAIYCSYDCVSREEKRRTLAVGACSKSSSFCSLDIGEACDLGYISGREWIAFTYVRAKTILSDVMYVYECK